MNTYQVTTDYHGDYVTHMYARNNPDTDQVMIYRYEVWRCDGDYRVLEYEKTYKREHRLYRNKMGYFVLEKGKRVYIVQKGGLA